MKTKELPLRTRIVNYFKNHPDEWIHKERITELGQSVGYMGETVVRRLREIEEGGFIKCDVRKHGETGVKSTWYRYTPRTYQEKLF